LFRWVLREHQEESEGYFGALSVEFGDRLKSRGKSDEARIFGEKYSLYLLYKNSFEVKVWSIMNFWTRSQEEDKEKN